MTPARLRRLVPLLATLALAGCHNQRRVDEADFEQARTRFWEAKKALLEGRLDDAHQAICDVDTQLITLRRRTGKAAWDDEETPPGAEFDGKTAGAWQDAWHAEFRELVRTSFDDLRVLSVAGKLDWLRARGFFGTYGDNKLDERWLAATKQVDDAHVARTGDQYLWDCYSVVEGLCDAVKPGIAAKTARPLTTEQFLTREARAALFGVITVRAETGGDQKYEQIRVGGGQLTKYDPSYGTTLPTKLSLTIEVSTKAGHSTWDGTNRTTVEVEAPVNFDANDADATWKRQLAALQAKLNEKVATLTPQTLTP
jgi:hypothetical protein